MKLPFTFSQFVKNPFAAIAILCILGMGYLYLDAQSAQEKILLECKSTKEEIRRELHKAEVDRDKWMNKVEDLIGRLEKRHK
tara:strand:+ start:2297 stop:2542 length:246 start_codon:yes stop_codon:yes gene_type:complete